MFTLLLVLFIIDVLLLIPIILLQSGSGAQSGVFGSDLAMGAFGAKSSEVMVKVTKWLVGGFLVLSFFMGFIKVQETKAYTRKAPAQEQSAPDISADTNSFTNTTLNTNTLGNLPLK